jgi:hypothetical protein
VTNELWRWLIAVSRHVVNVHLQKFDRGAEATFDLGAARGLLGRTSGFREMEPGVGEVEGDGYAEAYYGIEPSSDVMVASRAGSPETGWGVAVLGRSHVDDLPDASWEGWENFGEGFRPPPPVVCEDAEELVAALRSSFERWQAWAH